MSSTGSTTMSRSTETVVLQTLSALAILASVPPLVLHWKNRNFPATTLIGWYILLNLFNLVNAFIWPTDDMDNWWDGVGLCDTEVKLLVASYVAVPGCLVCIFRSLACVLDTSRATIVPNKRQRWRNCVVEIMFCVIIPIVAALLHMVYQGNRFFIFAISGCVSGLDESWISLALGYIWPFVICLVASYYCGLVLLRLRRYRNQFNEIIRAANSGLSKSRFLRLFFLSFIIVLAITPVQVYVVYVQVEASLPWHAFSWSDLHGGGKLWSVITKVPTQGKVFYDRWIPIAAGFMAFIFFGCGRDASRIYRAVLRPFGLDRCFSPTQTSSTGSFPRDGSGTTGSRAQLISGNRNQKARQDLYHTSRISNYSYHDLEKGISPSASRASEQSSKKGWLKAHLAWFGRPFSGRRDAICSTPHLAIPSSTISTNAWAGTSTTMSRDSIDLEIMPSRADLIRVKQVIRQEREMQV